MIVCSYGIGVVLPFFVWQSDIKKRRPSKTSAYDIVIVEIIILCHLRYRAGNRLTRQHRGGDSCGSSRTLMIQRPDT